MNILLNDVEIRVLGCLIEKEKTTPDYYPLTLNALTHACNQKSNRNPVVSFEETDVVRALESLKQEGLAEKIFKADSRVPKYQHLFGSRLEVAPREAALLCELMLRGPQTTGELRGRADRMYTFTDIHEVEEILTGLMEREPALVTKLPRQAGQKERRYAHLLSGKPEIRETEKSVPDEAASTQVRSENRRIQELEEELAALRKEFDALKNEFTDFKSQLE
jgi:uncharacterized protein YceH (UPF0502 family)